MTPGTINILVFTNKALTDSAMVKAMMTITEAKSAALQDWGVESVRLYPFINEDIPEAITKERKDFCYRNIHRWYHSHHRYKW